MTHRVAHFVVLALCWISASSVFDSRRLDSDDTESRLQQLENNLATLQSQSKSNDQKYAAIISNILSELAVVKQELSASKHKVSSLETEMVFLKSSSNVTARTLKTALTDMATSTELSKLDSRIENITMTNHETFSELKTNQSNSDAVLNGLKQSLNQLKNQTNISCSSMTIYAAENRRLISVMQGTTASLRNESISNNKLITAAQNNVTSLKTHTLSKTVLDKLQLSVVNNTGAIADIKRKTRELHPGGWFKASGGKVNSVGKLVFSQTEFQTGSDFNGGTGIFTAPSTGTYMFTLLTSGGFRSIYAKSAYNVSLLVGTRSVISGTVKSGNTLTLNTLVHLETGTRVSVKCPLCTSLPLLPVATFLGIRLQ